MTILECTSGRFIRAEQGEGWECRQIGHKGTVFPQTIYRFTLIYPYPLTWADDNGFWRPNKDFVTNLGSVPGVFRPFLPQSQYPRAYSLHDDAWGHLGLWWCKTLDGEYAFKPLSRWESNAMLRSWIAAEGGPVRRYPIWVGVSAGAVWQAVKGVF